MMLLHLILDYTHIISIYRCYYAHLPYSVLIPMVSNSNQTKDIALVIFEFWSSICYIERPTYKLVCGVRPMSVYFDSILVSLMRVLNFDSNRVRVIDDCLCV